MSAHTQGVARINDLEQADAECVVLVGDRQILECYEDGEVQTEEDKANAARVVKVWNAHDRMLKTLRHCEARLLHGPEANPNDGLLHDVQGLLREIGEAA